MTNNVCNLETTKETWSENPRLLELDYSRSRGSRSMQPTSLRTGLWKLLWNYCHYIWEMNIKFTLLVEYLIYGHNICSWRRIFQSGFFLGYIFWILMHFKAYALSGCLLFHVHAYPYHHQTSYSLVICFNFAYIQREVAVTRKAACWFDEAWHKQLFGYRPCRG
jgi:hypothetical protein